MKNLSGTQASKKHPAKKLTHTLMELEQALEKWEKIDGALSAERPHFEADAVLGGRDVEWLSETKKLLTKLKIQIAELDK